MREDASGRRQRAVMATDAEWERIGRAAAESGTDLSRFVIHRALDLAPLLPEVLRRCHYNAARPYSSLGYRPPAPEDRHAKLAARLRSAGHLAWPANPQCTNIRTGPVAGGRSTGYMQERQPKRCLSLVHHPGTTTACVRRMNLSGRCCSRHGRPTRRRHSCRMCRPPMSDGRSAKYRYRRRRHANCRTSPPRPR